MLKDFKPLIVGASSFHTRKALSYPLNFPVKSECSPLSGNSFCSAQQGDNKKRWSLMSHVLRQRRWDIRNEMRHFDSCKKKKKRSATAPDSGWRSETLQFMTNRDDKGGWLVHSSRSVKRSARGALKAWIRAHDSVSLLSEGWSGCIKIHSSG